MYRGASSKTYNQYSGVNRGYNQLTVTGVIEYVDSEECRFIQAKKDELLISLTKYFAKEIEKNVLETTLTTIKQDVVATCPSYTSRIGCC